MDLVATDLFGLAVAVFSVFFPSFHVIQPIQFARLYVEHVCRDLFAFPIGFKISLLVFFCSDVVSFNSTD